MADPIVSVLERNLLCSDAREVTIGRQRAVSSEWSAYRCACVASLMFKAHVTFPSRAMFPALISAQCPAWGSLQYDDDVEEALGSKCCQLSICSPWPDLRVLVAAGAPGMSVPQEGDGHSQRPRAQQGRTWTRDTGLPLTCAGLPADHKCLHFQMSLVY